MLKSLGSASQLSLERAALLGAIGERDRAAACLAALRGQAEGWAAPATQAVRDAEQALRDAQAAEEQAAGGRAAAAVAEALGEAPEPAMTAAEARVAVQLAEERLAGVQRDRDALEAAIGTAALDLEGKQYATRRAAQAVVHAEVAPQAAAIVARYHALQREFQSLDTALRWLDVQGLVPRRGVLFTELMKIDGAEPYRAALEALQRDAMAPLPVSGD